jgi:hypothetical protein
MSAIVERDLESGNGSGVEFFQVTARLIPEGSVRSEKRLAESGFPLA